MRKMMRMIMRKIASMRKTLRKIISMRKMMRKMIRKIASMRKTLRKIISMRKMMRKMMRKIAFMRNMMRKMETSSSEREYSRSEQQKPFECHLLAQNIYFQSK